MSADAHPATSTSLAPPPTNAGFGASETPSRAETLIEKNVSEKLSEKNITSATKSTEAARRSQEEKSAVAINEKNRETDLEKGSKATGNVLATERGATDQAEDPDADNRYITGFGLFLVFGYVNPYLKWDPC